MISLSSGLVRETTAVKYAAIADWAEEKQYSVTFMCEQLGVARRRLWATLSHPIHPRHHTDHWSTWRRIHQTRVKHSHYQRQRLKYHKLRLSY